MQNKVAAIVGVVMIVTAGVVVSQRGGEFNANSLMGALGFSSFNMPAPVPAPAATSTLQAMPGTTIAPASTTNAPATAPTSEPSSDHYYCCKPTPDNSDPNGPWHCSDPNVDSNSCGFDFNTDGSFRTTSNLCVQDLCTKPTMSAGNMPH